VRRFTPRERGRRPADGAEALRHITWCASHAVKFTRRDGCISVSARKLDGRIKFEIADTGVGIDASFLPHVFDRFRQADSTTTRRHGGLGLGLAIVRELVRLQDGEVEAASSGLGRGATFTVTLRASDH